MRSLSDWIEMDPSSVSGFHVKTVVAQKKQAMIEKRSLLPIFRGNMRSHLVGD